MTPFLIIIDEAWKLLSGKNTAVFISEASRTARKYKGGIVTATRHLTDFLTPMISCKDLTTVNINKHCYARSIRSHPIIRKQRSF